jgi:hypothetical protein
MCLPLSDNSPKEENKEPPLPLVIQYPIHVPIPPKLTINKPPVALGIIDSPKSSPIQDKNNFILSEPVSLPDKNKHIVPSVMNTHLELIVTSNRPLIQIHRTVSK